MKTKIHKILLVIFLAITWANRLQAYEIQIEKGPAIDAGPNTFLSKNTPQEGDALISWLGGAKKIKKILIGTPYINSNQIDFTDEYVRNRIEKSICVNSKIDAWHHAPLTMGTIYFNNGDKVNFVMYLSSISILNNLFALNSDFRTATE